MEIGKPDGAPFREPDLIPVEIPTTHPLFVPQPKEEPIVVEPIPEPIRKGA